MATRSSVVVRFLGDASKLKRTTDDVSKGFGRLGGSIKKAGIGVAAGIAAAGGAITAFAVKSASTFKKVGGEVLKLQRFTGATAEEASRLRFAAKQAGIDVEVLTKSLGLLSKNLSGTKLDDLGLGLKDSTGKAKPLNESLLLIAKRFESMPNGAEKTALAMRIFGRSGAQLIPFLNRGAEGIAELEAQSDKFGNTLSGKDLDAVKEATKNQRLFSSAMEGLQIQVGRYVLPIMTKLTAFLASQMPSAIASVRAGMKHLEPAISAVSDILDTIAKGAAQVIAILVAGDFKGGGPFAEDSPIIDGLFQLRDVLKVVGGFITRNLKPILIGLAAAFFAVTSPVTAIIAALAFLYLRFQTVRDVVAGVVTFFRTVVAPAFAEVAAAANAQFQQLAAWVEEHWAQIEEAIRHVTAVVSAIVKAFVAVVGAAWRTWGDNIMSVVRAVFGVVRSTIQSAVRVITGLIEFALAVINGDWKRAWQALLGVLRAVWDGIFGYVRGAGKILSAIVSGFGEVVGNAARGIFDGLKAAFKAAVNWIIRGWNRLEFKIPGFDPPGPGPKFGGFTLGVPDIPQLARGGVVSSPTLAMLGDGRGRMRREIATPEQLLRQIIREEGAGGVTHIWHVAGSILTERDVMALINRANRKGTG